MRAPFQGRAKDERKRKQQERIVNKDFPWMWAVRPRWYFGFHGIEVRNQDAQLGTFLTDRSRDANTEVWIRHGMGPGPEGLTVERVDGECEGSWAEAIIGAVAVGRGIYNIVLVCKLKERRQLFVIYRPSKGDWSFNPFLVHCRIISDASV